MSRRETYLKWIISGARTLEKFQSKEKDYKGCFFYPYWKKQTTYVNARWQEASFTFAWLYEHTQDQRYKQLALDGITYWCRLQKRSGSFPEYSRLDTSFAATAFTTLAMATAAKKIKFNQKQLKVLLKAADWLCKNDELVFINQEAAAGAALITLYTLTKKHFYLKAAHRKISKVLQNQSQEGYYAEKKGFDLGYSTLTLEMLGLYYLETQDQEILSSAEKFITFLAGECVPRHNTRNTNWVIIDGFEIFANETKNGKKVLKKMLEQENINHLEHDGNFCTDLYRHCWAYDHAIVKLHHKYIQEKKVPIVVTKRNKLLNLIRPFGLHRIRRYL